MKRFSNRLNRLSESATLAMARKSRELKATVVDVIVNSADHNTLETAVLAAGLEDVLSGPGPFTVFAPTDDAFSQVDPATLQALLGDPQGALTDVLTYHVVGGVALSQNITDGQQVGSVQQSNLTFMVNNNGVFVNGIQVTTADIRTGNGIVHFINGVLIP